VTCCDLLDRMRLGKLPEAWIAPHAVRELRELVRFRARLVMLRTGLKAQLKAVLAKHGLRPPVNDLWGVSGPIWLVQLDLPRAYTTRIESIRDLVEVYDREIEMLEREIHRELKDHAGYKAIQAIPGVGKTIAAIMVAEVCDWRRFAKASSFTSFVGLVASEHSSGQHVHRGHITKAGNEHLRTQLIEPAWAYQRGPYVGVRIAKAQEHCGPKTRERGWKAQVQLAGASGGWRPVRTSRAWSPRRSPVSWRASCGGR
jgi:transposase